MTSGTSDRTFVDTNVLIYAHDVDAGRKHERARELLRTLWADRAGILSTQVLQEFYVNATRKIRKPLTKPEARSVVDTYASWCVDGTTAGDLIAAFQIEDQARIGSCRRISTPGSRSRVSRSTTRSRSGGERGPVSEVGETADHKPLTELDVGVLVDLTGIVPTQASRRRCRCA